MKFLIMVCLILVSQIVTGQGLSIQQPAPGIYVHFGENEMPDTVNHGAIANIGFIVGNRCVAVIDTGGNPEQGLALKHAIETNTTLPVCYVINTHVHPDHIYGNLAFKSAGVKFIGHEKLPRAMAVRGSYYVDKALEQLGIHVTADNIIPPDILVKDSMDIDLGGRVLTLTAYTAAHTDNDLTVFDRQSNTLWMADLLFIDHLPVIDGSLKGWLGILDKLEHHSYKLVIPGHGRIVTNWPVAMQPEKEYLMMLLSDVRALIKKGEHLEKAVETVGHSAQGKWKLFDQFHRRNVTTVFAELEWED
ncbi:MAG: quinoprotein relay system zinc metallohydrolase 2 [Methylococcaceae bacterium]|nr:quinoprotein relay system zinc metallohydrolase 2 [Methylococcaceae bacterium]